MARLLTATVPQASRITHDHIKILWGARRNNIRAREEHGLRCAKLGLLAPAAAKIKLAISCGWETKMSVDFVPPSPEGAGMTSSQLERAP
jgi:hypothetical protein